jgi:hypothetical protein
MLKILIVVLLIGCAGASEIQDLQDLADSNHFKYQWQENVFECSDMSVANQAFLSSHGYETKIAIVPYEADPDYLHCITLVRLSAGWVGLDTRAKNLNGRNLNTSLGSVISPVGILRIVDGSTELMKFDRGIRENHRGPYLTDVIRPNLALPLTSG